MTPKMTAVGAMWTMAIQLRVRICLSFHIYRETGIIRTKINVYLDASVAEGEAEVLGTPLRPEECLFCPLKSSNLEENLSHMAHAHSFFLPDFEYITDLPGLVEYLGMYPLE